MQEQQTELERFRAQYPMYDDVSDQEVADRLYERYSDTMSREDFDARLHAAPQPEPQRPGLAVRAAGALAPMVAGMYLNREEQARWNEQNLETQRNREGQSEDMLDLQRNTRGTSPDELRLIRIQENRRRRAQERREAAEQMASGEREGATMHAGPSAVGGFAQSATDFGEAVLNAAAVAEGAVRQIPPADTASRGAAEDFHAWQQQAMPVDAARQEMDELGQAIAEGGGSTVPMLATGMAAGGGRAGTALMMAMGGSQQGSAQLDDAIAHGADAGQQYVAWLTGTGIGMSEAIPLARGMQRMNAVSPGRYNWGEIIRQGGAEAVEEALQEGFQGVSSNVAALDYDPDRDVFEGVGQSMLVGGIVGGGIGTVQGGVSEAVKPDDPQRAQIQAMEDQDLVTSRELVNAAMSAAYQEARGTGASTVETINALSEQADMLAQLDREMERRGLELAAPVATMPEPALDEAQPAPAPEPAPVAPIENDRLRDIPPNIEYVDPRDLQVDAETFQFKAGGDSQGVTDRLQGVTQWDPAKANIITVWENNAGERFIADGHQRRGLAMRLIEQDPSQAGQIGMLAQVLRESDGVTAGKARAQAALKNIAEGTGTAVDAAKVIREGGNIDGTMPRGAKLSQAQGLARLEDGAFSAVVNEVIPENQGAIVGRLVEDPAQQMAVIDVLAKAAPSDAFAAEAVVRQALTAPFQEQKTGSLFGEEVITQSLIGERAKVLSAVNREIRNNRRVFSTLTREADNIEGAGNKLDRDANARKAQDNGQLEQILQTLASRQGPVSEALNAAAQRYADGERLRTVARQLTADLQSRVGVGGLQGLLADGNGSAVDEPGSTQPDRAQQKRELKAQLDAGATADELQDTDIISQALEDMEAITPTSEVYDFASQEYIDSRPFSLPTGTVNGVDALLDYHIEHAKTFPWTDDDNKTPPADPVGYDREITFVIGYPAAGKSTIANPAAQHRRAAILDADEIKKTIPEYAGGIGAMATHEESSRLSTRLYADMLDTGMNILWPKVGNDPQKIERLARQAQEAGYSVNVIWVDTAKGEAMRRMISRFISKDRILPPSLLDVDRVAFRASYDYLRSAGIAVKSAHVDANAPQHIGPTIVEDNGGLLEGSEIHRRQVARDGAQGRGGAAVASGEGASQAPGGTSSPDFFGRVVSRAPSEPIASDELRNRAPVARGSAPSAEKNLSDIIEDLTRGLRISPARQGRLSVRGALGQMSKKSGIIRLRNTVDFPTLSHEAGHSIAFMHREVFDKVVDRAAAELGVLAGGVESTDSTLMDEGFAELVRLYLTAPQRVKKYAPNAMRVFEQEMFQANPEVTEALQDAQRAYTALLAAPSGERIAADVVHSSDGRGFAALKQRMADPASTGNALSRFADGLYTATIDKLHPIFRAEQVLLDTHENNTGERLSLAPSEDSYKLARLATDARSRGHMDLMHGVTPYDGIDPEGPSLAGALEHAFGRRILGKWDDALIAEFDSYLISRRAVVEWQRFEDGELPNAPDKFSRADHDLNLAELNAKYPEFSEAAEMVYAWNDQMLRKKVDAGLISEAQYEQYTRDHPDYVPFMRDMRQGRGGSAGARVRMDNSDNGQRRFKGSDRAIISPIEMMMRDAFMTAEAIARNDMIGALYDLANKAGLGSGQVLEEIPNTQMRAERMDAKAVLEAAAREAGVAKRDLANVVEAMDQRLGGQTFGTIYRSEEINSKGERILYLWRNGERKALRLGDDQLGRELFDAYTAVGREQIGFATEVASVFASGLRYGITTSPDFLLANYVRDQLSAWILTDNFTPIVSGARQLAEDVANDGEISRRYNTFGGIMGGGNVAATSQASIEQDINALRKKGYQARRFANWRGFAEFTELSETNTRMALFNEAFKNAKKQGMSDRDAAIHAAFVARDYIDFGRYGSKMLAAKRVLVFLNASLQGLDKSARVLSGGTSLRRILRPLLGKGRMNMNAQERADLALALKAWAKVSLALGGASLALSALNEDEPWYHELSEYARDTHWWVKIGDEVMGIPKPFELAVPANIIERAYELHHHNDPNSWERMRNGVMRLLMPPVENPLFSVPIELYANKDFFRGRQIIPDHMQGQAPAEQWNAYTSAFGKQVGQLTGLSPMVIDHVVTGFGGSWGRTALNASNALAPDGRRPPTRQLEDTFVLRRFFKDPFRGARSVEEFWDRMNQTGGQLQSVSSTYARMAQSGQPERAAAWLLEQEPIAREFAIAMHHVPPVMRGAHPMIRADGAMSVYSEMRREINGDGLRFAGTERLIEITPDQAAATDLVLRQMLVLEAADALARTGFEGYQGKPQLDRSDLERQLNAISPVLTQELQRRMMAGRVLPHGRMVQMWPRLQAHLSSFDQTHEIEPWARRERMENLRGEM